MRTMTTIRRWTLGAAVTAALGFGAAQAAATPAQAAEERAVCNAQLCNRLCQAIGTIGGTCSSDGSCFCYL